MSCTSPVTNTPTGRKGLTAGSLRHAMSWRHIAGCSWSGASGHAGPATAIYQTINSCPPTAAHPRTRHAGCSGVGRSHDILVLIQFNLLAGHWEGSLVCINDGVLDSVRMLITGVCYHLKGWHSGTEQSTAVRGRDRGLRLRERCYLSSSSSTCWRGIGRGG